MIVNSVALKQTLPLKKAACNSVSTNSKEPVFNGIGNLAKKKSILGILTGAILAFSVTQVACDKLKIILNPEDYILSKPTPSDPHNDLTLKKDLTALENRLLAAKFDLALNAKEIYLLEIDNFLNSFKEKYSDSVGSLQQMISGVIKEKQVYLNLNPDLTPEYIKKLGDRKLPFDETIALNNYLVKINSAYDSAGFVIAFLKIIDMDNKAGWQKEYNIIEKRFNDSVRALHPAVREADEALQEAQNASKIDS